MTSMATENEGTLLSDAKMQDHYDNLSLFYDEFYDYETAATVAMKYLDLQPDDKLADVGGGTGGVAEIIYKRVGLVSPVLVIDPNAKMLEIANKKEGVETMLATVDEFLHSPVAPSYNKILMARCIHHFFDLHSVFEATYKVIPKGGICLIFRNGLDNGSIPFFQAALDKKRPGLSGTEIASVLTEVGFTATSEKKHTQFTCSKDEWYCRIRYRFTSILSFFTDSEIEKGITELENSTLKGKDTVVCNMHMDIITGVKLA